jgi:hypothetical protein
MVCSQILCRYVIDMACDTCSDAGFKNGYETRALK